MSDRPLRVEYQLTEDDAVALFRWIAVNSPFVVDARRRRARLLTVICIGGLATYAFLIARSPLVGLVAALGGIVALTALMALGWLLNRFVFQTGGLTAAVAGRMARASIRRGTLKPVLGPVLAEVADGCITFSNHEGQSQFKLSSFEGIQTGEGQLLMFRNGEPASHIPLRAFADQQRLQEFIAAFGGPGSDALIPNDIER